MPPEHKLDFELFGSEYFAIRGCLIGQLSITANDQVHRAAANDVDFRIRAARGSGATDCYPPTQLDCTSRKCVVVMSWSRQSVLLKPSWIVSFQQRCRPCTVI